MALNTTARVKREIPFEPKHPSKSKEEILLSIKAMTQYLNDERFKIMRYKLARSKTFKKKAIHFL